MNDISIDLETLSTRQDAAILSIGAAKFDRHTGEIGDKFYAEVIIDTALEHGHVSGSTLSWWMQQGGAAKRVFAESKNKIPLHQALTGLVEFIGHDAPCVWGNGATFDISILEHAYQTEFEVGGPWDFWKIRDMRTIVDVAAEAGFSKSAVSFEGTEHNALDDAVHQAKVIAACFGAVRKPVVAPDESACITEFAVFQHAQAVLQGKAGPVDYSDPIILPFDAFKAGFDAAQATP